MAENITYPPVPYIATDLVATDERVAMHYHIVVLRDDQLALIREIVRDEIAKALKANTTT